MCLINSENPFSLLSGGGGGCLRVAVKAHRQAVRSAPIIHRGTGSIDWNQQICQIQQKCVHVCVCVRQIIYIFENVFPHSSLINWLPFQIRTEILLFAHFVVISKPRVFGWPPESFPSTRDPSEHLPPCTMDLQTHRASELVNSCAALPKQRPAWSASLGGEGLLP